MEKILRKTSLLEKEVFTYLNELRESGETNMFGAAPYIQREFALPKEDASKFLLMWMKVFNKEGNYDEIAE